MSIPMKRTLFVGLGGTGVNAILRAKSRFTEVLGKVPDMIEFLGIDTDQPQNQYNQLGNNASLDRNQYVHINVDNIHTYLESHPEIASSVPEKNRTRRRAISNGAGQMRSFGRLAFIHNYDRISNSLNTKINNISGFNASQNPDYDANVNDIQIIVCFSLGGGTGSGTFIDFPVVAKEMFKNRSTNGKVIAIGLLPDIFQQTLGDKLTAFSGPSAATALTEYEFIAEGALRTYASGNNLVPEHGATHIVPQNGGVEINEEKLYDRFYLVNNQEINGQWAHDSIEEMLYFMGNLCYSLCGAQAAAQGAIQDNIDSIIPTLGEVNGKAPRYIGAGFLEVTVDKARLTRFLSTSYSYELIQNLKAKGQEDIDLPNKLSDKTKADKIKDADTLIDNIKIKDQGPLPPLRADAITKNDASNDVTQHTTSVLPDVKGSVENNVREAAEYLKDDLYNNLVQLVREELNSFTPGNISALYKGLKHLKQTYLSIQHELAQKQSELGGEQQELENQYRTKKDRIKAISDQWYLFGSSKKNDLQNACHGYLLVAEEEVELKIKEYKYREADAISQNVINLLDVYVGRDDGDDGKIGRMLSNIADLENSLSNYLESFKNNRNVKPFRIYLDSLVIDQGADSIMQRINYQDFVKEHDLSGLLDQQLSGNAWYQTVEDYVSNFDQVNELQQKGILDIIESYFDDSGKRLLADIIYSTSGILWNYEKAYGVTTAKAYLVGINTGDTDSSNYEFTRLLKQQLTDGDYAPDFASIPESDRITIVLQEAAVPAFTISTVDTYMQSLKKREENHQDADFYSNAHWKRLIGNTYSIFPPRGQEDPVLCWALGFVFQKISREGPQQPYKVHSETEGDELDDYKKTLNAGRRTSYDMFKNLTDVHKEILRYVARQYSQQQAYWDEEFRQLQDENNPGYYMNNYANLHVQIANLNQGDADLLRDEITKLREANLGELARRNH